MSMPRVPLAGLCALTLLLALAAPTLAQLPEIGRLASANETYGRLGSDVTVEVDFDGDGLPDLAAAFRETVPGVRVHSGLGGGLIRTFVAAAEHASFFGLAITALGDVDGDGCDELVLGLPEADGFQGEVRVLSGGTGIELHRVSGGPGSARGSATSTAMTSPTSPSRS